MSVSIALVSLDLAKTTAKLVEHPGTGSRSHHHAFAEVVGQENVIAGTDRGLVTLRMRFREPGLACAQISISIDDRFELLNDRLAEGIHYKRFRRKSFFLMVFSVCLMPRLLVAG